MNLQRKTMIMVFDCIKYKTDEYIRKAFIVVFHESSSIIQAIMLKKRIICLEGNY